MTALLSDRFNGNIEANNKSYSFNPHSRSRCDFSDWNGKTCWEVEKISLQLVASQSTADPQTGSRSLWEAGGVATGVLGMRCPQWGLSGAYDNQSGASIY